MNGRYSEAQMITKEEYPYIYFVHSYPHKLNLIMTQTGSQNREVRICVPMFQKLHSSVIP